MNSDIEQRIQNCTTCAEYGNQQPRAPLNPSSPPVLPYSDIAVNIFDFENHQFLLIVDYYSKFVHVSQLTNMTSSHVVTALKRQFSIHGIPKTIRSDNGTQFLSGVFKDFCNSYGIIHRPVSPHYQRAYGLAEKSIGTIKRLWEKSNDKHLAILDYNSTPLEGINLSPSQLLMGRRPRNLLPAVRPHNSPSSYIVESNGKHYRRNRQFLRSTASKKHTSQCGNYLPLLSL